MRYYGNSHQPPSGDVAWAWCNDNVPYRICIVYIWYIPVKIIKPGTAAWDCKAPANHKAFRKRKVYGIVYCCVWLVKWADPDSQNNPSAKAGPFKSLAHLFFPRPPLVVITTTTDRYTTTHSLFSCSRLSLPLFPSFSSLFLLLPVSLFFLLRFFLFGCCRLKRLFSRQLPTLDSPLPSFLAFLSLEERRTAGGRLLSSTTTASCL